MSLRVVVSGGTGLIGRPLTAALLERGHTVQVLTRDPARAAGALPPGARAVGWDPGGAADGGMDGAVQDADVVVNLAGASIASGRWSTGRKEALRSSRLQATNTLVRSMGAAAERAGGGGKARALVSSSAIGYYGDRGEEMLAEASAPGTDFLAGLCVEWEAAARGAERFGARVALVRTGIVLAREGGALPPLAMPFRFFVGGPLGSGRQWYSWVHQRDVVGLYVHAVEGTQVSGPLNATAALPVRQADLARAIGAVLGRPSVVPAPAFALRVIVGEMADALLLASQRVLPTASEASGYRFVYRDVHEALRSVLG